MKTAPKLVLILGGVAAAVVAAVIVARPLLVKGEAIHYVTRPVGYADITATVSETGTVNPVNTVSVGSEVSGTIKTLGVDFNSHVKKGQILATLDPTDFQASVDSASANLRLAEANLNSANVGVGKMKALLDMSDLTLQRDQDLFKQGLINQNQVDTDSTARTTAYQDYLGAQASVQVADAQVAVARGNLDQARFNLTKTVIRSPMDGIVLARTVSIGQTVAASLQTPTLFSLASNLTDMQVDTSVDEADAGSVRQGATARFTVTAYPNETFSGTVVQVRVNPTITQNVVTYDAVVAVHDSSGRLLPGMTAQVTIDVGKVTHVPAVPIAGVLYRPLASGGGTGGGFGGFGGGAFQSSGAAPGAQAVAGAPGSQVTVWVLQDGRPVARRVVIGLSDSTSVQIASGSVNPGDPIIVAQRRGSAGGTRGTGGTSAAASSNGTNGGASSSGAAAAAGSASGAAQAGLSNASGSPSAAGAASGGTGTKGSRATGAGSSGSGERGPGTKRGGTGTGTPVPPGGITADAAPAPVEVQSP
jgi:HlyD family secretion protein